MMKKEIICEILHLYIKDYEKEYLKKKKEIEIIFPNWRNERFNYNCFDVIMLSKKFKITQKNLENIRKNQNYKIIHKDNSILSLGYNQNDIIISTYGVDTWRKNSKQNLFK
jgi:hypothetical protein